MSSSHLNTPHPSYLSKHRNSFSSDPQRNSSNNNMHPHHSTMEYFGHHYAKSEEDYKHEMMALRNIPHKTTSQLVDQMDCVKHVVNMHHAPRGGNHGGSHATSHSTGSSSSSSHHRRSTGNLKDLKSSPKQQSAHQLTHSHHHESSASDHHKSTHKKH